MADPSPDAGPERQARLGRPAVVYAWLSAIFCTSLIVADIVGVKLFRIDLPFTLPLLGWKSFEHTCGMLTFPVTFLLTDLLNEYYGKRAARRVVYIGFAMGLFVFTVLNISRAMPHWDVPFNVDRGEFDRILGAGQVMFIASLCAYLSSNLVDIAIFASFKRATRGRHIWLRATGSTLVSQLIDSFIVTYLAFGLGRSFFSEPGDPPPMPAHEIINTALTGYVLKFLIAVAITPLIYAGRAALRDLAGLTPIPAEQA
ncbi:MAG TPA: queuosine precursor transporter [Phycisphaerales bacterium]|nr:queuosine precursor transporter [Phycisphaerales bacterium]